MPAQQIDGRLPLVQRRVQRGHRVQVGQRLAVFAERFGKAPELVEAVEPDQQQGVALHCAQIAEAIPDAELQLQRFGPIAAFGGDPLQPARAFELIGGERHELAVGGLGLIQPTQPQRGAPHAREGAKLFGAQFMRPAPRRVRLLPQAQLLGSLGAAAIAGGLLRPLLLQRLESHLGFGGIAQPGECLGPPPQRARGLWQQLAQPSEGIEPPEQLAPPGGRQIGAGFALSSARLDALLEPVLDGGQDVAPGGAVGHFSRGPLAIGQIAEELRPLRFERRLDIVEALRAEGVGEARRRQADRRHARQQRIDGPAGRIGDAGPGVADVGGETAVDGRNAERRDAGAGGNRPFPITPTHAGVEADQDRARRPLAHRARRLAQPFGNIEAAERRIPPDLAKDQHVLPRFAIRGELQPEFTALCLPTIRRAARGTEIGVVPQCTAHCDAQVGMNLPGPQRPASQRRDPRGSGRPEAAAQEAALDDDDRALVLAIDGVAQLPLQGAALGIGQPVHDGDVAGLVDPAAGKRHPHAFDLEPRDVREADAVGEDADVKHRTHRWWSEYR